MSLKIAWTTVPFSNQNQKFSNGSLPQRARNIADHVQIRHEQLQTAANLRDAAKRRQLPLRAHIIHQIAHHPRQLEEHVARLLGNASSLGLGLADELEVQEDQIEDAESFEPLARFHIHREELEAAVAVDQRLGVVLRGTGAADGVDQQLEDDLAGQEVGVVVRVARHLVGQLVSRGEVLLAHPQRQENLNDEDEYTRALRVHVEAERADDVALVARCGAALVVSGDASVEGRQAR
jgi:hypothetical protein